MAPRLLRRHPPLLRPLLRPLLLPLLLLLLLLPAPLRAAAPTAPRVVLLHGGLRPGETLRLNASANVRCAAAPCTFGAGSAIVVNASSYASVPSSASPAAAAPPAPSELVSVRFGRLVGLPRLLVGARCRVVLLDNETTIARVDVDAAGALVLAAAVRATVGRLSLAATGATAAAVDPPQLRALLLSAGSAATPPAGWSALVLGRGAALAVSSRLVVPDGLLVHLLPRSRLHVFADITLSPNSVLGWTVGGDPARGVVGTLFVDGAANLAGQAVLVSDPDDPVVEAAGATGAWDWIVVRLVAAVDRVAAFARVDVGPVMQCAGTLTSMSWSDFGAELSIHCASACAASAAHTACTPPKPPPPPPRAKPPAAADGGPSPSGLSQDGAAAGTAVGVQEWWWWVSGLLVGTMLSVVVVAVVRGRRRWMRDGEEEAAAAALAHPGLSLSDMRRRASGNINAEDGDTQSLLPAS